MKYIFTLLLLFAAVPLAMANDSNPPNIVLILSDDQGFTDYGFMGHPHIETPNLDRLAKESALFRRGYVPTALCRPSLMTLITGLYPHEHRTTGNNPARSRYNKAHEKEKGKPARELLISHIDAIGALPQWLAKKGYVSHQSGKWWEGSYKRAGFTEGMTKGYPNKGGRHGDAGLKIGRNGLKPVTDFIDRSIAESKPFFVWYAPFMPHTPHTPPKRLLEKYIAKGVHERIAKYYAMCEWFDETCGELVSHIDKSGIRKKTLIVFVTDNGWIQTKKGRYGPRSKRSPHEMGTRTPIMFRWPETIPASDRPELCSSIDFVPTVLAAANAKGPHEFPGLNLLPQLKSGKRIDRDTLFGAAFAHDIANIENPNTSVLYRWVIHGNHKLILANDSDPVRLTHPELNNEPQLYDLAKDPFEKVNLAAKNPERVKNLSNTLNKWKGWYVGKKWSFDKDSP